MEKTLTLGTNILNYSYSYYEEMSQDVTAINVEAIIDRLKIAYGYKTDMEVARRLGMSEKAGGISKAIRTNSINLQRVVERCPDLNQDWLIWGRGEMRTHVKPNIEIVDQQESMVEPIPPEEFDPHELAHLIMLYKEGKLIIHRRDDKASSTSP